MSSDADIRFRFARLAPTLDERALRLFAAAEADALGYGGVSRVSRLIGLARSTILRGQHELAHPPAVSSGRIRQPGGGRKKACEGDPTLVADLERLVEPLSRGDPMSPLRWTSKSIRTLAATLRRMGGSASGSGSSSAWPMKSACRWRSRISRRARASGTRSSTGCFPLSVPIGAVNR